MLELRGITKRYDECEAVRGISLSILPNELHAVMGENGAGKSTLLQIAAGIVAASSGEIHWNGALQNTWSIASARAAKIGMVTQHFALIDGLSVLENIVLSNDETAVPDLEDARRKAETAFETLGYTLPLDRDIATLSVVERQRVELVRILSREDRIVILDEPTAVLSPLEIGPFYASLRALVDKGYSVVVVTHKLEEARLYADRITVLRHGRFAGELKLSTEDRGEVVSKLRTLMMGESPGGYEGPAAKRSKHEGVVRVSFRDVCSPTLRNVTLDLHRGEVLGLAGIEGSGAHDLVALILGEPRLKSGAVSAPKRDRIAFVPEDRQRDGLVLDHPAYENALLSLLETVSPRGIVDEREAESVAKEALTAVDLLPLDLHKPAATFSGGNQQKIVVARALLEQARGAELIVLVHPTRGIDALSQRALWDKLELLRAEGATCLLVSHDLDELRALSDRIAVLREGMLVDILPNDASNDAIGKAMIGAST